MTSRYPISEPKSIYTTKIYLKATIEGNSRTLLNDNYEPEKRVNELPNKDSLYYQGMSVNYSKLGVLGADFDGDKMMLILLWGEESNQEIDMMFGKRIYYVDNAGKMSASASNQVVDDLIKTITKRKK